MNSKNFRFSCIGAKINERLEKIRLVPGTIENSAILVQPDEFIGTGYRVKVALFAVVKISVGFPNPRQHRYGQGQSFFSTLERQASIHPRLAKVTIHRVCLKIYESKFFLRNEKKTYKFALI